MVDDRVHVTCRRIRVADHGWPYTVDDDAADDAGDDADGERIDVPLVPYREWGNRGPSTMRVWIPTTD